MTICRHRRQARTPLSVLALPVRVLLTKYLDHYRPLKEEGVRAGRIVDQGQVKAGTQHGTLWTNLSQEHQEFLHELHLDRERVLLVVIMGHPHGRGLPRHPTSRPPCRIRMERDHQAERLQRVITSRRSQRRSCNAHSPRRSHPKAPRDAAHQSLLSPCPNLTSPATLDLVRHSPCPIATAPVLLPSRTALGGKVHGRVRALGRPRTRPRIRSPKTLLLRVELERGARLPRPCSVLVHCTFHFTWMEILPVELLPRLGQRREGMRRRVSKGSPRRLCSGLGQATTTMRLMDLLARVKDRRLGLLRGTRAMALEG